MTALTTLQTQLESILNQEGLSEDFKEALRDAINACNLGSWQALNQWISHWVGWQTDNVVNRNDDYDYIQGVRFVEQQWEKVTGMF